jgi:hypothetical protein
MANNMGPGYFPTVLSYFLIFFGVVNITKSISLENYDTIELSLRPLFFILLANILFGLLLPIAGLIVSITVLVMTASQAHSKTNKKENIKLAMFLSLSSYLIFSVFLGMPFKILPWATV